MSEGLYIGVMSGTSLDGIDVVLAAINENQVISQARYTHPIPIAIKKAILALCRGDRVSLVHIGEMDRLIATLYVESIHRLLKKAGKSKKNITAIGCHGQTVWHQPQGDAPFTLQLGDNNRVAGLTGITTIGDFRRRDMAYGGQGAPLVPAFHHAVLAHPTERRVVLNIGGMANVSLLLPGEKVIGFDTGPGNILLDGWIEQQQGKNYDHGGAWGAQGKVHPALLLQMLTTPYFSRLPPKSTGRELFNLTWLKQQLDTQSPIAPEDVQATLAELTARTVTDQVQLCRGCQRLLVCGGGAHNMLVMSRLAALLPGCEVSSTQHYGIGVDDMEALAFAWLAYRTLSGLPGNLPSVTGASQLTVLGAIYPANPWEITG